MEIEEEISDLSLKSAPSRWDGFILKEQIEYYHDVLKWIIVPMSTSGNKRPLVKGPRKNITFDNCLDLFRPYHRNIAVLAGERSRIGVADFDDHLISLIYASIKMSGVDWYDANVHRAVIAPMAKSSTGRGFHLYFEHTKELDMLHGTSMIVDRATGKEAQIDFLVRDHPVMLPPSIWNGWTYKWETGPCNSLSVGFKEMPQWLLNLLTVNHKNYRSKIPINSLGPLSGPDGSVTAINPTSRIKDKLQPYLQSGNNNITIETAKELLDSLNFIRADNYNNWIEVGFAIVNEFYDCSFEYSEEELFILWDEWSQKSDKYDENISIKTWENLWNKGPREEGITFGTVRRWAKEDKPDEYRKIFPLKREVNPIKVLEYYNPETSELYNVFLTDSIKDKFKDLTVNTYSQRGIREYSLTPSDKKDTLIVQACMGQGKTKAAYNLISNHKRVLIITFRKTLGKQYLSTLKDLGFKFYLDVKEEIYDLDKYPRFIVQIDSLGKIRSPTDLIVIDEIEYAMDHLVSFVKDKNFVYKTLIEYIKKAELVLAMDAFITENTVKFLHDLGRKIHIEVNEFRTHTDKTCYIYNKKRALFQRLIKDIEAGKKVIFPTNSKKVLKEVGAMLEARFPDLKRLLISSETVETELDENITKDWNKMDFAGFTPSIVAGISFEEEHFDVCYGYFTPNSSHAEMSVQQLFRVRDLKDKEFHTFIEKGYKRDYPVSDDEIEKLAYDRNTPITNSPQFLLERSNFNNKIIKDQYFCIYSGCVKKQNLSRNNYEGRLMGLLASQGVKIIIDNSDIEEESKKVEIEEEIKDAKTKTVKDEIEAMLKAVPIENEKEFEEIKKKKVKTGVELVRLKKYRISCTYDIKQEDLTEDFLKKYRSEVKLRWYKNLKYFGRLENPYEKIKEIAENEYKFEMFISEIEILHQQRWGPKVYFAVEILTIIGFYTPFNKNKIKKEEFKFKEILEFLVKNGDIITALFNLSRVEWRRINVKDEEGRRVVLTYINKVIKFIFGMSVTKNSKNKDYFSYQLSGLNIWNHRLLDPLNLIGRDPVKFINIHYRRSEKGEEKTKLKDIYDFFNECWPIENGSRNVPFSQFKEELKPYYNIIKRNNIFSINVRKF